MMKRSIQLLALILAVAGLLGGCTYNGTPATPVERNLTWFSYLNGDDIRQACRAGTPNRYRFVYNGIYIEQARAYDLAAGHRPDDHRLNVRVFGPSDLGKVTLSGPSAVFDPWQPAEAVTILRDRDLERLKTVLAEGPVSAPLNETLQLSSDDFYWVVSSCTDGAFRFNAFRWPSERFAALRFPDLLFAWDSTGVPVNPPREVDPNLLHQASSGEEMRSAHRFNLAAGPDGLKGLLRLF